MLHHAINALSPPQKCHYRVLMSICMSLCLPTNSSASKWPFFRERQQIVVNAELAIPRIPSPVGSYLMNHIGVCELLTDTTNTEHSATCTPVVTLEEQDLAAKALTAALSTSAMCSLSADAQISRYPDIRIRIFAVVHHVVCGSRQPCGSHKIMLPCPPINRAN